MTTVPRQSSGLPRRIAYLTDPTAWGGAEIYLTQLLTGVRDSGFEPHVMCSDRRENDEWVADIRERGFEVERFRPTKEFNPLGILYALRLLRGYDVIHFNKTDPRTILPAITAAAMLRPRLLVTTEHLAQPVVSHFPMGRAIITSLVRLTNRFVDVTIAVSELSRSDLIENYRVRPSKIVAIRNGIDLSRFEGGFDAAAIRNDLGLGDAPTALQIGRLEPRKRHSVALHACAAVRKSIPDFRMVFVGKGELEDELIAEAEALGLADVVVFAGFRTDIPEILAASDLLILPSSNECLPLTILEAMASGLPVVASDVGGVSEEVEHGVTGLLVSPDDAAGLADAIVRVLGSPDKGRAMGEAGRRKVEKDFGATACTNAVVGLYEKLYAAKLSGRGGEHA